MGTDLEFRFGRVRMRDPGHLHGAMLGWRFHKQVRNPEEGISGDPCAQMIEGMRVRNPLLT